MCCHDLIRPRLPPVQPTVQIYNTWAEQLPSLPLLNFVIGVYNLQQSIHAVRQVSLVGQLRTHGLLVRVNRGFHIKISGLALETVESVDDKPEWIDAMETNLKAQIVLILAATETLKQAHARYLRLAAYAADFMRRTTEERVKEREAYLDALENDPSHPLDGAHGIHFRRFKGGRHAGKF